MALAMSAADLIGNAIANLEAQLGLNPGDPIVAPAVVDTPVEKKSKPKKEKKKATVSPAVAPTASTSDLPDICKLEFKVGIITKVWVHEKADKLYCEEIDVGEESPRQIASGLRPHFSLDQMLGQRLLVISNLKAKNLVGFKSHGMVLCAAEPTQDGSEKVEFVEPPVGAVVGEVVTFEGLPSPAPASAAQVEKKKIFQTCAKDMKTTDECLAAWNGKIFITSAGPCKAKTIAGGVMR